MISSHKIRKKYLEFFAKRGHAVIPSSSLLPANDPTTLFTGSGMQPMITYLLGAPHPSGTRIADSQKCFRAEDVEEVGDNRHLTFFEMLGNWSLGDYFKKEQIPWIFEFVTRELELDPKRIYVSVFGGDKKFNLPQDTESVEIWKETFAKAGIEAIDVDFAEKNGMGEGRIFYYPDKKNWWSRAGVPANMPVGEPGGPDSEMFWDFGERLEMHERSQWKDRPCHPNCDCGRFLEIGNSVFMSYLRTEEGFKELPKKNIDFGGGLERTAAAVNDDPDLFLTDLFTSTREILERRSGEQYREDKNHIRSFRFIMDHMRAVSFLIADGALPSNKDQGYFTRRLIRRSIRFAHQLGIQDQVCQEIVSAVVDTFQEAYPTLGEKRSLIQDETSREEEKFRKTLASGLKIFERSMNDVPSGGALSGRVVFDLYQTYGFPYEITEELANERGSDVDKEGYQKLFEQHQDLSRAGAEQRFKGGLADHSEATTKLHTAHHLLLKALQVVLGSHVKQRGSNITGERLRIDFSHGEKMTSEQLKKVEGIVNEKITEDLPVIRSVMAKEEAEKLGAEHEFNAKYPDMVSVYFVGSKGATPETPQFEEAYSLEFCAGPHVERTGLIGKFKITKEEAVSAGMRRIKAVVE